MTKSRTLLWDFEKPFPADRIYVPPRVALDRPRQNLLWRWWDTRSTADRLPAAAGGFRTVAPGAGLLQKFILLAAAAPEAIQQYAATWGVLGVCAHHLPAAHHPGCRPVWQSGQFCDPLEAWRRFAREAGAILRLAGALRQGRLGDPGDWQGLKRWVRPAVKVDSPSFARQCLSVCVDRWLEAAGVRPVLIARGAASGGWKVALGGGGYPAGLSLLGAVGCHLLFALVGSPGWAICASCQKPFTAERRPRDDRRAYCLSCRHAGRPQRDAARDYRRRQARRAQRRRAR